MREELILTLSSGFKAMLNFFGEVFGIWGSMIWDSPLGRAIEFVWGIIRFIYNAGKSIYYLVINLFESVTGSVTYYVNQVFDGLGFFIGGSVSTFISLFQFVLILIVFSFVVRVILGKFHYNNKTKK